MKRRSFIKNTAFASLALTNIGNLYSGIPKANQPTLDPQRPLAINMWDNTWLLRHYKGGSFEDWDKCLDELLERGYNALRIDCFPQLIAADDQGNIQEKYTILKNNWGPALWGNQYSTEIEPHASLLSFMRKCRERDIYIGLSSWFLDHSTGRINTFKTVDDVGRAWHETLQFLDDHGLLENIIYVDLLNEYPLWNGYCGRWLSKELNTLSDNGNANVSGKGYDFLNKKGKRFNTEQIIRYNNFINNLIEQLAAKWPNLSFFASQTNTLNVPWQDLDISRFAVQDVHCWFVYNADFSRYTNYFQDIHVLKNDIHFRRCSGKINEYWNTHKKELTAWMEEQVIARKEIANKQMIPYGNTEGWGAVMWMDHPGLNWDFIKEAGLIGAELGNKHGYAFNCSSNFNHPHFGLWNDIEWHKEVTNIIKNA